jgi:hypothetical protein
VPQNSAGIGESTRLGDIFKNQLIFVAEKMGLKQALFWSESTAHMIFLRFARIFRAAILPNDGPAKRASRVFIPSYYRFTLFGNTD